MPQDKDRLAEFSRILQKVNTLYARAEAKPPYSIMMLDKAQEVRVLQAANEKSRESNVEHLAKNRLLEDPDVMIGKFTDSDGRNVIEPWVDSHSMFAGFKGNFNLITQAPSLLFDILELFIPQAEPEPEPEPEPEEPPIDLDFSIFD